MNQTASVRPLMKRATTAMSKSRGQEAVDLLQQVLALNPGHAEALHHIAFIMHSAGNYPVALDYYQRAIQADPAHIESYLKLSRLLQLQNRGNDAIAIAHRATQLAPDNPATHVELAGLLLYFNRSHEVPAYLEHVMPHFPDHVELQQFYCMALKINDRRTEADAAYNTLITRYRVPASFRLNYETYLPRFYRSVEEIDAARAGFMSTIERFTVEKPRISCDRIVNHPLFVLAFHHRDNKELVQSYTRMLRIVAPELNYVAPHCKKPPERDMRRPLRIGFISGNMHHHSVGNAYRNVMLTLAKEPDFSVTFFNLSDIRDDRIQLILDAGVPIVSVPKHIETAQQVLATHQLDILIYTDIGIDATTHQMAMARLAHDQVCFQGHPETTGIDTIDYVISSRSYEPLHANDNYCERLLCNEGIDTIFMRPKAPQHWLSREELALPLDKKLYVCPMAIQKFHPDFDDVLARILAEDPNATLLLFNDFMQQSSSQMLQQRVLAKCDAARVVFLPWQPLEKLFSIMKASDAILDTIYFGGGSTSQYAFAFGLPIVTMPGDYARGRVVLSYYSMMGIDDAPIAKDTDEYVRIAIKLANQPDYAAALSTQINERNHLLFESAPFASQIIRLMNDIWSQQLDAYALPSI